MNSYPGTKYDDVYKLTSASGSFQFKLPSSVTFPAGSICTWSITKADGTVYTEVSDSYIYVSLSTLGFTDENIGSSTGTANTITASCTISHPNMPESGWKTYSSTVKIYKPVTANVNMNTSASITSHHSTAGDTTYGYIWNGNNSFTFSAAISNGTDFPAGTTFNWIVYCAWNITERDTDNPQITFVTNNFRLPEMSGSYTNTVKFTATLPDGSTISGSYDITFVRN